MSSMEMTILSALRDGRLPCAFAFQLVREHGWTPEQLGAEVNRLEGRISRCQLGLFGYDSFRQKGLVQRLPEVPGDVTVSVRSAARDEAISCAALWEIAKQHGLPRVAMACVAETLDLRIAPCQLGCF